MSSSVDSSGRVGGWAASASPGWGTGSDIRWSPGLRQGKRVSSKCASEVDITRPCFAWDPEVIGPRLCGRAAQVHSHGTSGLESCFATLLRGSNRPGPTTPRPYTHDSWLVRGERLVTRASIVGGTSSPVENVHGVSYGLRPERPRSTARFEVCSDLSKCGFDRALSNTIHRVDLWGALSLVNRGFG